MPHQPPIGQPLIEFYMWGVCMCVHDAFGYLQVFDTLYYMYKIYITYDQYIYYIYIILHCIYVHLT